ncbi:SprT family zinc-dependent metalloprotease [Campylobacter troglodytis]|uniref:SprT family zinc-dependent metalloprotease n=1 Tax=Campylobacter troglodytis TaxID=654363 RepID=UPI00115BD254|nr:SprT family zinc-dependent metalloprotease [Campylobacter troglodytis]TQR60447.1 hypothetical protein DMC01_05560 [Campylobacter troglodytis]
MNALFFKLIIKDYDLLIPLKDKEIQITNIDSKQSYESKFTTRNGEVIFEIPSNERGDFFSIKLINDSDYEQSPYYLAKESDPPHTFSLEHYNQTPTNKLNLKNTQYYEFKNTTNKILSPNNYQKCPATLYFKAKIYLHFNGFTLFMMQGDKVRASYEARSGKALNLQEKDTLKHQNGYKHFVPSFSDIDNIDILSNIEDKNDDLQSNHTFFHCYDKGYQDENKVLQDKIYYINTQEIKDFINANNLHNTDFAESISNLSLNIYADKECNKPCSSIIMLRDKNLANNKQIQNDLLLSYDDAKNLRYILNNTNRTNVTLKVQYSKPTISHIKFIENIEWGLDFSQNLPQVISIDKQSQTKIRYLNHSPNNYNYPIKVPFAPGSYIELEAVMNDDNQTSKVEWWYAIFDTKLRLDKQISDESKYFHKNNQYNKIGFYLPLRKQNDKDYAIVCATLNNAINAFILISIDFNVGIGADNAVRETQRNEQNKMQNGEILNSNDISEWNKLEHIYSIDEALWFLKINLKKLYEFYQSNRTTYNKRADAVFDYFRTYPQLAGKIAYIYYRFDLGNDEFIDNAKQSCYVWFECKDEYKDDRDNFINSVVKVFENDVYQSKILKRNITFKEAYNNALFNGYSLFNATLNDKASKVVGMDFYQERENFVKSLIWKICSYFKLNLNNVIVKDMASRGMTSYYNEDKIPYNTVAIDKKLITYANANDNIIFTLQYRSDRLIATIIHECRHLYIYEKIYKEKPHKSPLLNYLAYSFNFYISGDYIITKAYKKLCNKNESNKVNCYLGQNNDIYQSTYEIQPNERDPRYMANEVIKRLGIKQK